MNFLKNILGRIFATWGILVFVTTMLIFFIPLWLSALWPEPKRISIFLAISRFWMLIYFPLVGLRIKVMGREHFKKNENYIVVCNHNSLMDVPVSTPQIPGANKTIAKIEMANIPIFGILYRIGAVLVDRKDENSRRESYVKMKQVLALGMHMCIYPEGTRNKTNNPLKDFHSGAFRLAKDTRKPIIPALIFNTRKALPQNKPFYFWPVKLHMDFLEPIEIEEENSVEELKEKVFRIMWDYYAMKAPGY